MFDEQDRKYFYDEFKNNGYQVGSYDDFKKDLNNKEDRDWYYNEAKNMGYDVGTQADFDKMVLEADPSSIVSSASASPSSQSKNVQEKKEQSQYPKEVMDAYNSPDNKPGNFKDLAQLNEEYQRGKTEKASLISQALDMIPKVDAGNIGREQKVGGMIASMLLGGNMQQPQQLQQPQDSGQQVLQTSQEDTVREQKPAPSIPGVVNSNTLIDAKFATYLEDWKKRPDKENSYFQNLVADLEAEGMNPEEAIEATRNALGRYANRSAMDVTGKVVSALPDDTVEDAEKNIEEQWYSHGVQDKLKQEAQSMGISYDDYVAQFLKPAMAQSLVQKYGQNYRNIAEGIATRLYSHEEHVQDRLMNQDINDALSDVINKYVNHSVVDEYNKAQEAGSKAFNEGMEGSQNIPASLRLGTAIASQYEANQAKDPQKTLSALQKKFNGLYKNPQFLNDMSNAAFKVMQRYGMNGTLSGNPKQFKPMIDEVLKAQLNQLEVKNMIPKGSAEYIMNTGLGNTIVGKITRKLVQTDYQNWLEDIANQQYQPGFWDNVASGALTFAGDAWSYWLPGAAGGKITKSMLAKAEGKLATDLWAKGMERKMAERAAKVLVGKSKGEALKSGAVHGAVTFGGQSAISKPIDEVYRTGQFDENGKVYNPSVGKILANTLREVAKQSVVGAIMQGGTVANIIGKGRGLATNILADVGGKVVDSSIMTGQQMLERMAQDPNFKPTGKDAAESFLESMANLTAIGLPGMMGKYARFKDAKEFNRKFDFNEQDLTELKRFGYDGLRDAFEKMGINGYRADGENVEMMGQLTQKYMDLMNDKSVPETLKGKMMAVVEGKRPSSFSPVVDSEVYRGDDGKYYLDTYNKDGGVVERKEYSSHESARKDEKKLDYEKSLNLTSAYENVFHTDALQDRLNSMYQQATDRYAAGEKLSEEDKTAIYLHQNASAINDIIKKQQSGMELTSQEQQLVNTYRSFYDRAFENSPIMKEYVRTFEDSQGVEHGSLRKALEGDGKSRTAEQQKLVEEYQKQLYNDIVLKREMNDSKEEMIHPRLGGRFELPGGGQESSTTQENTETVENPTGKQAGIPASSEIPPAEPPAPPVSEGGSSVPSPSDAYVMGQNAYKSGDNDGLKSIDHNADVAELRLQRAFGSDEKMIALIYRAIEEGRDMEVFVQQRAGHLTPLQKDAIRKYTEAMDAKKGVMDAVDHADDGYGEALTEQLWPYATEDGNIVPVTLQNGETAFIKKANEYGGAFITATDENGQPVVRQVSSAQIKETGTPVPFQDYVNQLAAQKHEATLQSINALFDGSDIKQGDTVEIAMDADTDTVEMQFVGYSGDGKIVLSDGRDQIALSKDEYDTMRTHALRNAINAELDAEDVQRTNDDAAKVETEKQERYKKGIWGYAAGQPDYADPQTDPKVAAEYLQEASGDNRKALFSNIAAEKQALQTRISQLREHIANNEEWLSLNADLDPRNAESRTLANKQMKGQITDLQIRLDNWNKIRSAVMTPEEATAIKNDRTKKIADAGVNEPDIVPVEGREVAVLSDEELKKQYPTMDEASDYIVSERKRIYQIQNDEVQREIDGVDEVLNRYKDGEIDLESAQIKELNTTKAQLMARQQNLTESAKDLKAQADRLNTLYRKENMRARAKQMEAMSPAEQRAVQVENAVKNGNLSLLNSIYEDVRGATDFTDTEPNTLEEYVASCIGRYSLNYEGKEKGGAFSNGLQQETGLGRADFKKLQILAKEGEGQTVAEFVQGLYNHLPQNLKDMGYTDQDIRNAFLSLIGGADSYSDLKNYTLNNRIADAERNLQALEQQEAEMMEAAKEMSHVNDGEGSTDNQGNPVNEDGTLKLDKIKSVDDLTDDDFLRPTRNVELPAIPKNIDEAIGANGKPVIIKKNIFERNSGRHDDLTPEQSRQIIKAALFSPDLYGQNQKTKRPYNWVLINTKDEKGKNRTILLEVSSTKKNVEVVHWYYVNDKNLELIKKQAIREGDQVLILPSEKSEEVGGLSNLTDGLSSVGKGTNISDNSQGKGEKFSLSEKKASNGEQFYQDESGNIDLAQVPDEVFSSIGYTKAPFRLTPSMIEHMLARHNKELKFKDENEAIRFVRDVIANFDHVRLGNDGALVFSIENGRNRTGKRAITVLINSNNGEFYGLKTSGYEAIKGLEKRPLLWERGAKKESSSTDAASASVSTSKSSISGEQSGSASHQSIGLSGKGTNISDNSQGKGEKFSERLQKAIAETETEPSEAQKKVNYNPKKKKWIGMPYEVISDDKPNRFGIIDGFTKNPRINAYYDTKTGSTWLQVETMDNHAETPERINAVLEKEGYEVLTNGESSGFVEFDNYWDAEKFANHVNEVERYVHSPKDNQGNPVNEDGTLKLDKIKSVDDLTDDDFLHPVRNVQMPTLSKKVADAIGTDNKPVIIKKNIFERNYMRHKDVTPKQSKAIFKAALYNPDLYGQNQKSKRPYNWVLINTKDEQGKNRTVLLEVNPNKDNVEIVHWHFVDERGLEKIKKQVAHEDGQLLILPSNKEEVGALSDPMSNLSAAKIDNSSETSQGKGEKFSENLPFGAQMSMDELPFHRDVKEVKPSNMTEAQQLAYKAVSTMLKKAGIPVKVISNEDMEKVAEEQDNLIVNSVMNSNGRVSFLRTYHGSGADFTEFDFDHMNEGAGSQAFGWGGYVTSSWEIARSYANLIDDDPSKRQYAIRKNNGDRFLKSFPTLESFLNNEYIKMGKFSEEEKIAYYNERAKDAEPYHNLYEVNIPDDNGKNYMDWDAPLTDEQQKNIYEALYDLPQDQLDKMAEDGQFKHLLYDIVKYIDKDRAIPALVSDNTITRPTLMDEYYIPNIGATAYSRIKRWLDSPKEASKFLSKAGFTGIKYYAGRNFGAEEGDMNYVIFKPEDMKIADHTKFARGKGVVYGYTDGKEIVLNQEHLNPNTPIHEYQHIWRTAAKEMNPELIEHGDKLIMQTQLFADLKEDPNYKHLSDEKLCDEAFARLTGEDGAKILEDMAKEAIKENPLDTAKELNVINKLKDWLKKFWYWTLDTFTKWKPEDIKKMTLEDIRNLVLRDLAQGVDPRNVKSHLAKDDAISLRQQMEDNAEQERVLEHTEENWLKEFGKDGRVSTPIGSIKLGENQYKKAGREDRIKRFGLLKPTLERPDVILEKSAPKEDAERQTKYLFIKSFKKADGTKILNYESITVKQGEDEVAISAHQIEPSKVVNELTESKVLWNRFRGDSNSLGENQGSALTPSANNPSGKDSVLNPHSNANIGNNSETAKKFDKNLSEKDKEYEFFANRYGTETENIAKFDEAMQTGNVQLGHLAMANIRRAYRINHSDMKLSMFTKMFNSVKNELYSRYGNLDELQKQYEDEVMAERNVMEAARKKAEEEEAKKQKHLEELSLVSDAELDKRYMDALGKGDDATAREMLDESARRKGYGDVGSEYQGQGAWAAPSNPHYESDEARRADVETNSPDVNLEDMALGYNLQPADYFDNPRGYMNDTAHGLESSRVIKNALDALKRGEKDVKVKVYRAVPTSVKEGKLRNGDWVTPSKKYAEMHGNNRLEGKYRIIEDEVPANQLWWDGNDANEFGFDDGKEYKYKNAKNNRKLNDLVTYDDKGNVILPSQRFNSRKKDIRFMFAGERGAAEADKTEEKTYRMDNLKVAEDMERGKKDAKAIKLATGWERGADGKWRYEVPDVKIKDTIDIGGGNIRKRFEEDMLWNDGKLEKVVDAPELFKLYPQLEDVRISTDAIMDDMPANGSYNPNTRTITIHADELKYLNSILNHEIQHAIQHIEGFAKGGNAESIRSQIQRIIDEEQGASDYAKEQLKQYATLHMLAASLSVYKELVKSDQQYFKDKAQEYYWDAMNALDNDEGSKLVNEYPDNKTAKEIAESGYHVDEAIKELKRLGDEYKDKIPEGNMNALDEVSKLTSALEGKTNYELYRALAGEVEARNVEKRLGMTDEERRNSLASETEDVNRDEQIVMDGNWASYSIVQDPKTIEKLDKEETVKVYRAMQVGEDGKLYPPMAAKVKGKFVQPIELGKWEQADERPELADDKGMFTLNKGNGKSLKAAYNPYLHTSRTPLNDQFSEAQNRPNIVTVEVEVPKSELTSGYKAEKAKDAVGEVEWKAGIIQGQLTGKRKVILSRWDKPVRIVPDSEVADVIVNDMFKGTKVIMPTNVVTPSLKKELEKRGVPFVETDNRGRIVGGENDGVHYSKIYGKNHREKGYRSILKFSLGDNGTDVANENGDSLNKNPNKNLNKDVITRRIGSRAQAQGRVNETLGAAAADRQRSLGATAKEQRPTWNRRSALGYVRRRAEELSSLLTEKDLEEIKGIFVGHGQENYVYRAKYDPTKVIKFNDFGMTDSLFRINEFIDRVNAHNQFQPNDRYTPIGFAYDEKGDFCIVMEQPFMKGTYPTREEITQYLTDHGFKLDMIQISADEVDLGWTNGEFDLWDAEPRNVIKDENGDLHFFDTMIQHTYIPNHKNPLRLSMPSIRTFESQEMKDSADKVKNVANVLGGAEVTSYTNASEVPDEYKEAVEQGARGWYDPATHTVHVYLPNCADANEAQRTVFHEKIGHEGMEVLLGGESGVRNFANFVYKSVGKKLRGKILDFANKYDPDWKNPDRMNVGTQEYIAHLAEEGPHTAEDFSLWTKIKHYLVKVLKNLGIRVPGLLNDKDLRYYLMKAGKALHTWDNMPKAKQEAIMAQASNAEIKDALSDGAGKGKPRQKKGESAIQYMKRVMEWKRWKEAREDIEDPEPPQFYDFDKDTEGKKEWERLNKEWRDAHGLRDDEMPLRPERKEGETDEDFLGRYKEWEKWNTAIADKENPMPDMFSFEKERQKAASQRYEDWLARHELLEQQQADLDLYEGKIYPAETNPEADGLEQRVMQDLAEVTSTDVSKEGAARTVKHAVIHRRKNMEEASADDAIYINDVKNRIEKMAESGAFDKLLSDFKGEPNKAEKLAEAIPYIIEAPRRLRDIAHDLNNTGAFDKGHLHIQPTDVESIQPFVEELAAQTAKKHTVLKNGEEVEVYDDPQAVSEVASKMAQAINRNHQGEENFVPIDGTDILNDNVLPLVKQQVVPRGIDYQNLSPEMQATIDSIRDWYNYTYDWLKDNHTLREDTGFNADYVNHIWDKEKSDKQAYAMYVENRQRAKSPNEKPRTISTLIEGINAGLVPKTTDITKMMAYYSRSNIEAWANKTMLQEVSGLNVVERDENGDIISSDPLLSSVAPINLEQYKYFEIPGVGPVWVYNVSPKEIKIKNPITDKEKVLYSEASAGDRFGVVFDTYQSTPFWKFLDTTASSMKKLELGFSGFHAGALTEVYMVQNAVEFGPKKAIANFMKYIFADTMKTHQLPCFANPEDFQEAASHLVKFGATNDYAAADVQNMFDNFRDGITKIQEKLDSGNVLSKAGATASLPFKIASQMLSLVNKGMDRALWDFLHDGLKLATYNMRAEKTKERAKAKGWTAEQLSKALDEDGQFVNDMFGGQHWDVLGASHRALRYAGRFLLSPDWNTSTTRHFLALTGYGSVWNEATMENFTGYYKRLWSTTRGNGTLSPDDWGRTTRQLSSLLCYGIGFMVFYEAFANGINAAFRAMDEEKEREKAEETRRTSPGYRSPYELAYPDGMKWYDYLMRGNTLGQQSKIFLGRYADGTEMYIRHGKQFREVPEYLFNHKGELEFPGPMVQRMLGKANPLMRMTLDDINYLSDFQASHADQELQQKYGKTIGLLYKDALYWAPFLIPSQENKEFKAVDFFFPSSKGFSAWKAQDYFKNFILSGDMEGVMMAYQSCQKNGIDAEKQLQAAITSIKAMEAKEMQDGVTSLQIATQRFDKAKSVTEKRKMREKMRKFLSQSEYKAFTQQEAMDMVRAFQEGVDPKELMKSDSKYLMIANSKDVTEDWRIQQVRASTKGYDDKLSELKDADKAKAGAFRNAHANIFKARKTISKATAKMNKLKKKLGEGNDEAIMKQIRTIRKDLLKDLNGMEHLKEYKE